MQTTQTTYYPAPGDKVEITSGAGYRGERGIVSGIEADNPAQLWLYIQLGDLQTVCAKPEDLHLIKAGGSTARQLATEAAYLRHSKVFAPKFSQRYKAAERLDFLEHLLAVLARH